MMHKLKKAVAPDTFRQTQSLQKRESARMLMMDKIS